MLHLGKGLPQTFVRIGGAGVTMRSVPLKIALRQISARRQVAEMVEVFPSTVGAVLNYNLLARSYSGNPLGASVTPSLTAVHASMKDMGKAAGEHVCGHSGGESNERIDFPPELVVRESTRPVKTRHKPKVHVTAVHKAFARR